MNYELVFLVDMFLIVGVIGAIISILSIVIAPKNKKINNSLITTTFMFFIIAIIIAVVLLNSFNNSIVNLNEDTKVVKVNNASNDKSKSIATKDDTKLAEKSDNSTASSTEGTKVVKEDNSSKDKTNSTTIKEGTSVVEKNDKSTINTNTNNNNVESETKNTNKQYDNKKGKYYIPKFNKYVDSEQELYDTFGNESKATPFNYIETDTGKGDLFAPASGPSSDYN
jgi:hypothetical protein